MRIREIILCRHLLNYEVAHICKVLLSSRDFRTSRDMKGHQASNFQTLCREASDLTEMPWRMRDKRKWRPSSPSSRSPVHLPYCPAPSKQSPLHPSGHLKKGFCTNRMFKSFRPCFRWWRRQGPTLLTVIQCISSWGGYYCQAILGSPPNRESRHGNPTFHPIYCNVVCSYFF